MVRILFFHELDIMFIYNVPFRPFASQWLHILMLLPEENFKPAYLMNYKTSKTC